MNNIYVPVHVFALFRRILNVVSSFSITNHYVTHERAKPEKIRVAADGSRAGAPHDFGSPQRSVWEALPGFKAVEWPWWTMRRNWDRLILERRFLTSNNGRATYSNVLKSNATSTSWPWLRTSTFSSLETINESTEPHRHISPPQVPKPKPPSSDFKLPPSKKEQEYLPTDIIHQLLVNPVLYDPLRTPRYPIVLCHGLYGFDSRGPTTFPSMRMHYWSNVLQILRNKVGAEVIVTSVPGTGSISARADMLHQQLRSKALGRGVNLLAHSMGGLDCRHLITHIQPEEYVPLSLTSISTPHRGSPFMDWCAENIGIGKLRQQEKDLAKALDTTSLFASGQEKASLKNPSPTTPKPKSDTTFSLSLSSLPSSFTTLLLSIVDSPAYSNLTSTYLNNVFNPGTPDDPRVKYFSVAGRMAGVSVWHPFWLPKMVLDGVEEKERSKLKDSWEKERDYSMRDSDGDVPLWAQEREWGNDGLVTVQSAKWGEFLGIMEGADHWEMRGARGIEFGVDLPAIPSIGLGGNAQASGDGWGLRDWGRFVGAWKKADNIRQEQEAVVRNTDSTQSREQSREHARQKDDDVVKSSTDRLSFVFDWLIDQIPAPQRLGGKSRDVVGTKTIGASGGSLKVAGKADEVPDSEMKKRMDAEGKGRKVNELAAKQDLERFYVALSRKMYDEGL